MSTSEAMVTAKTSDDAKKPRRGSPAMVGLITFIFSVGGFIYAQNVRRHWMAPAGRILEMGAFALVAATALGTLLWYAVPRIRQALDSMTRRSNLRKLRAIALKIPLSRIADLKDSIATPVRVCGRVHFESDGDEVHAWIVDETAAARLHSNRGLRAIRGERELDSLRAGDDVEIVATGRRIIKRESGYRDVFEFCFDADHPIQVWLR